MGKSENKGKLYWLTKIYKLIDVFSLGMGHGLPLATDGNKHSCFEHQCIHRYAMFKPNGFNLPPPEKPCKRTERGRLGGSLGGTPILRQFFAENYILFYLRNENTAALVTEV